jgi:hypothetical protein
MDNLFKHPIALSDQAHSFITFSVLPH